MRERRRIILMAIVFLAGMLPAVVQAGQVVTEELRVWAKEAAGREAGLEARGAEDTVAVLYFQNRSGNDQWDLLQKGITFMLMTDLSQVEDIRLVERVRLQALLEEMKFGTSGLVEPVSAPKVGRLLGARYLVGGDILAGSSQVLSLTSTLLDVPPGQILGRPAQEGRLEEVFQLEKGLLFELVALLRIELSPDERRQLSRPLTTDTEALFSLFEAIDLSDRGEYRRAAACYRRAIQRDPELGAAREGLEELTRLELVPEGLSSRSLLVSLHRRTAYTLGLRLDDSLRRARDPRLIEEIDVTSGSVTVRW